MAWVGVTGFGSFVGVPRNPSEELASALAAEPPLGVEVRHCILPVTLAGSARELDRWLDGQATPPRALLALGVHDGPAFRLERRAGARLHSEKRDNDGVLADGVVLPGADELFTSLDLAELASVLRGGGAAETLVSEDAGGFVCERVYHRTLTRGQASGVPSLFLHVPPLDLVPFDAQLPPVRALVAALAG